MKKYISIFLMVCLMAAFTACRGEDTPGMSVKKPKDEPQTPVVRQDQSENFRGAMTSFASALLRAQAKREEKGRNILIAPYSVLPALAMTANGAAGETKQEMESVLGREIGTLNKELSAYAGDLPATDAARLRAANGIWINAEKDFKVSASFAADLKTYYRAELKEKPFGLAAIREINAFVKKNTNGMIPEILDRMNAEAVMYLVNALGFDAKWARPYEKNDVEKGVFTAYNGTKRTVKLMRSSEGTYLENDKALGMVKDYEGHQYAFVALLPKEGVDVYDLLESLDADTLDLLLSNKKYGTVHAALPKFTVEYGDDLVPTLGDMGMATATNANKADFSGMGVCKDGRLYIETVLHKAKIQVDELGTKAGAATAVSMDTGAASPDNIISITLDRPFVYFLIDAHNDLPLFCGVLSDIS